MILLSTGLLALIIGIGICILTISIILITSWDNDIILLPIAIAVVSVLTIVFPIICICTVYDDNATVIDNKLESTVPLYALGSGNGIHGNFVFGCGSVNDIQYYIGYTNIGDNAYKQVKYDASMTTLRLDDNETPRVETYSCWITYQTIFPFISVDDGRVVRNIIYIPTDGLSNTYAVN